MYCKLSLMAGHRLEPKMTSASWPATTRTLAPGVFNVPLADFHSGLSRHEHCI